MYWVITFPLTNQLLPDTGSELIVRVLDSTVVREGCLPGGCINETVETATLKIQNVNITMYSFNFKWTYCN